MNHAVDSSYSEQSTAVYQELDLSDNCRQHMDSAHLYSDTGGSNKWYQSFQGLTGSFIRVEQINLKTVYSFRLEVKI